MHIDSGNTLFNDLNNCKFEKKNKKRTDTEIGTDNEIDNENIITDSHLQDVGLKSETYYNSKFQFSFISKIRSFLLPFISYELPILIKIQKNHSNFLTNYFLYTANIGSHTFYVLILPLPLWIGSINLTRDLVFVLGLGIYFTGFIKDLLCLPRPKSPPIKRLTLSHYTSKEYGCPSSHSANAISVCLVIFFHTLNNLNFSNNFKLFIYSFLIIYYLTLSYGRLYCGMHGLLDILIGSIIGLLTFLIRFYSKNFWDNLILNSNPNNIFLPLLLIIFYYSLLLIHPKPIEQCPCFEDTIAFISVLLGLDLTFFSFNNNLINYNSLNEIYIKHPSIIKFNLSNLGYLKLFKRLFLSILSIISWKILSKQFLIFLTNPPNENNCYGFMKINDKRIFNKIIVYSGIPFIAIYVKYLYPYFNL